MIKRVMGVAVIALSAAVAVAQVAPQAQRIRVATWNLENLFDADDDPVSTGDDEYLPHSWRRWTPARYAQKLTNAAHVVAALRPDVLCVQEVENRRVLQDLTTLLKTLSPACSLPHISHRDSGDARGIDVGLVSRFPIVRRELHQDIPGMRGALITTLDIDGAPLTVVTCHWKSWVGDAEANVVTRLREALAVRAEVDRLRAADPSSAIVVAGDFNDNHDGHSLQQGLAAYTDRDRVVNDREGRLLYNVLGELPTRDLGSYYYARRKVWNTFDALVIVPGMLAPPDVPGPPWRLAPSGAKPVTVFKRPEMLEADGRPKPFRRVRLKDGTDSYAEGYSDHLPIVVELVRAK